MNAYLVGTGISTIGILSGAVLALWWRAKCAEAKGNATLLLFRLQTEEKEHNLSLQSAVRQAETFEEELGRKEILVARYKDRLHSLRVRELDTANHAELLAIANGLRMGVSEDEEARGEVANEDSDAEDTLP